jgi:two-component system response regulator DegU
MPIGGNKLSDKINIVLIDNHQLFREGVKRVLDAETDFNVIVSSDDYSVLQSALEFYELDVILLDVQLFQMHAEHMEDILKKTSIRVIVLGSGEEKKYVPEAIRAGVHGYLLKEMDIFSFVSAIKEVQTGVYYVHPSATNELVKDYRNVLQHTNGTFEPVVQRPLHAYTKRECEVLQLLTDGQSNRQIAKTLDISEKTVKNHVSSLFKKMQVHDRTQAVVKAIRNHWVEL